MFTLTLRKKVILALTLVMALAFAGVDAGFFSRLSI